jgi:integration host factor beta subunit
MTKSELINRISERLPYLTRKDAEIIVNTIFDSMVHALVSGNRIEIRGFGSFKVKNRGDREGRNPKTGETVKIPAKRMPFFKIGKELFERINPEGKADSGDPT